VWGELFSIHNVKAPVIWRECSNASSGSKKKAELFALSKARGPGRGGATDLSVNIVVNIQSGEDIVAIYSEMKKDPRVKWLI
jgi:hypothetical protein